MNYLNKRLRREAEESLGKPPDAGRFSELESISEYHRLADKKDIAVDETTWRDLDMDDVFDRLNTCGSSVGEEYLYALLHRRPDAEDEELFRGLSARLENDRELRISVCAALRNLGIFNYNGAAGLCFSDGALKDIGSETLYTLLPVLTVLIGTALILFKAFAAAAVIIIGGLIACMAVNVKIGVKADVQLGTLGYLCRLIFCAGALGKLCPEEKIFAELSELYKPFSKAAERIAKAVRSSRNDLSDIANFFTLGNVRCYCRVRKLIEDKGDVLGRLYRLVGMTDAVCAALNFKESAEKICVPEFTDERIVKSEELVHPLIENAVPNSIVMDKNVLLTGSNASGKSSFIKALTVNVILAQSIFLCTAESFVLKRCGAVTSMAVRDDLCAGESYFVAEIKSMRRLIEAAENGYRFCAVDEILKGTNTAERIAASASILKAMSETDSLFIAATHDTELTELLADRYRNMHFSETVRDSGVTFDYKIKEGPAGTRNAIKLLKVYGFPESITAEAEKLADTIQKGDMNVQIRDPYAHRRSERLRPVNGRGDG